jgi:hypothetical protein
VRLGPYTTSILEALLVQSQAGHDDKTLREMAASKMSDGSLRWHISTIRRAGISVKKTDRYRIEGIGRHQVDALRVIDACEDARRLAMNGRTAEALVTAAASAFDHCVRLSQIHPDGSHGVPKSLQPVFASAAQMLAEVPRALATIEAGEVGLGAVVEHADRLLRAQPMQLDLTSLAEWTSTAARSNGSAPRSGAPSVKPADWIEEYLNFSGPGSAYNNDDFGSGVLTLPQGPISFWPVRAKPRQRERMAP